MTVDQGAEGLPPTAPVPTSRLATAAGLILQAVWFGLVTGILHAGVVTFRQQALGQLVFYSQHVVWMAPMGHVVLFVAAALLLGFLTPFLSRPRLLALGAGWFAFLGTLSLLIPHPKLAGWAALLLAAGVGTQVARAFPRLGGAWVRLAARSGLAVVLAILLVSGGLGLRGMVRRSTQLAALPAPTSTPNVLLVILDTVRAANLSLYGYGRPTTPFLERLARDATVFDRAFAPAPWTLPSHATVLTGLPGSRLGGDWLTPATLGSDNLARLLGARGYLTSGFVGNLLYTSYESGLAEPFLDYDDYRVSPRQIVLHAPLFQSRLLRAVTRARSLRDLRRAVSDLTLAPGLVPADEYRAAPSITDAFLAWQQQAGDRPFFAFLNYFDAHGPYHAPAAFMERFRSGDRSAAQLDRYDAAIAFLDSELDRLLGELAARGVLDRTLVVVTSDHGELFGEHGLKGHANALYLPLLQVPLLVRLPGSVPGGGRVGEPVSLIDLPRTILELVGHPASGVQGSSLANRWSAAPAGSPSPVVAELSRGRNVDSTTNLNARTWLQTALDERHHYIRDGLGREELFDYLGDPAEGTDLAQRPELRPVVDRLRAVLDSAIGNPDSRPQR